MFRYLFYSKNLSSVVQQFTLAQGILFFLGINIIFYQITLNNVYNIINKNKCSLCLIDYVHYVNEHSDYYVWCSLCLLFILPSSVNEHYIEV